MEDYCNNGTILKQCDKCVYIKHMQLFPRTHVYLHLRIRTTCVDLQVQA